MIEEFDDPIDDDRPKRGRAGPRFSGNNLVFVPPTARARIRHKLREVYGVRVGGASKLSTLTIAVAKATEVPEPTEYHEAVAMLLRFSTSNGGELAAHAEPPPFVPLRLSREMERALARAAEVRRAFPESDGSIVAHL